MINRVIALIILSLCALNASAQDNLIIRGELAPDILLGIPISLQTFSDNSFVVSEWRSQRLLYFNEEGELINRIGRRGRGPGEFLEISNFKINSKDEIIVFDNHQIKATVFNRDFEFQDFSLDREIFSRQPNIRAIHQLSDGNYLLGIKNYSIFSDSDHFLYHFMSKSFEVDFNGIVKASDLHDEKEGSLPDHVLKSGGPVTAHSVLTKNDKLVIAPVLYNGEIFIYSNTNDYSKPQILKTQFYPPAYELYKRKKNHNASVYSSEHINLISSKGYSQTYHHLNRSHGLFTTKSGLIIHFVEVRSYETPKMYLEILNKNASEVLEIREIKKFGELSIKDVIRSGETYDIIFIKLLHYDNNDNLYVYVEGENYEPELHVIKFPINVD